MLDALHFSSWSAFWQMGGYGFFVWLSFGSTALLLVGLHLYSRWQRQHFIRQLHAKIAREARIQQHQSES